MYSFANVHGLVPEGVNPVRGIEKYGEEGRERLLLVPGLRRAREADIGERVEQVAVGRVDQLQKPAEPTAPS